MVDSLKALEIISIVCTAIVFGTTLLRLYLRRQLWWDDACALLSLLFLVIQIAGILIHTHDPAKVPQRVKITAYYLMAITFYGIIWFARLSILFSIIRIAPGEWQRRRLLITAGVFALTGMLLAGQIVWVCVPDQKWRHRLVPQCPLATQVVVTQLITDVVSDLILMVTPLNLFRTLTDKTLRRRLMIIFSTSIATTIVSLAHAVCIIKYGGNKVLIAAIVESCVSLMVCNLPVVVAAIFRARGTSEPKAFSFMQFASNGAVRTRVETTFGDVVERPSSPPRSKFPDHTREYDNIVLARVDSSVSSIQKHYNNSKGPSPGDVSQNL